MKRRRFMLHTGEPTVRLYPGRKTIKRIVKFLAEWQGEPKLTAHIIGRTPDGVLKGLANLAYNIAHNEDIDLTPAQKRLFAKHRKGFDFLTDRRISLARKRAVLLGQEGGALPFLLPLIPLIAKFGLKLLGSAALGAAAAGGTAIANKVIGGNQEQAQ